MALSLLFDKTTLLIAYISFLYRRNFDGLSLKNIVRNYALKNKRPLLSRFLPDASSLIG